MLSFISGIINAFSQASISGEKARVARRQGNAARTNADLQAANIMRTAEFNLQLESHRRKAMRRNQNTAVQSVRTKRASSGFTSQGSASQAVSNTEDNFNQTIDNASRSAAIAYANEWQQSIATQTQGKLAQAAYQAEAQQYNHIAKAQRFSAGVATLTGIAGAALGYQHSLQQTEDALSKLEKAKKKGAITTEQYNEKKADILSRKESSAFLTASVYSSDLFNNALGLNMYTAGITRRQTWDSAYSLLQGNTPGFQHSKNTL